MLFADSSTCLHTLRAVSGRGRHVAEDRQPGWMEDRRICWKCGADYGENTVICTECGIDLRTGEEVGAQPDDGPELPRHRTVVSFIINWMPGLLRPVVIVCSIITCLIGLAIVGFAIRILGFGVVLSSVSIGAAGLIVYAHGISWILAGEFGFLSSTLVELDGKQWLTFFALLLAPIFGGACYSNAPAERAWGGHMRGVTVCETHENERVIARCTLCGRGICKKCRDAFGYYCSEGCREKGRRRSMGPSGDEERRQMSEFGKRLDRWIAIFKWRVAPGIAALIALVIVWKATSDEGEVVWEYRPPADAPFSGLALDGDAVLASCGETLRAFDARSGKALWAFDAKDKRLFRSFWD